MADETTERLALPLIAPGQAQKEMTHNEALAALDVAVQACVAAAGLTAPPAEPALGECWIVGGGSTGAWTDRDDAIAGWTAGGWRFVAAREGLSAWVAADGVAARYADGAWRIGDIVGDTLVIGGVEMLAEPVEAIESPTGGTTIDTQARTAIAQIVAALAHHGLMEAV